MKFIWAISAMKKWGLSIEWNSDHFVVCKNSNCLAMAATFPQAIREAIKHPNLRGDE
jgi:hypothetical protein